VDAKKRTVSVAMTADVDDALRSHLMREDGQEDVCLATYSVSTGARRTTMLVTQVELPRDGERLVHGNASFTGEYVLRVASEAAKSGQGIVVLHSHPRGRGWQGLSYEDHDSEQSFKRLALTMTGLPLIGMTLAGADSTWSARQWTDGNEPVWAESVRVVGDTLRVAWNDQMRPAPALTGSQVRTVSAWGPRIQADVARLRILVVGVGSVGLDVAQRLAATGIVHVAVMDYDAVEVLNLDRMIGATRRDARQQRAKVEVAAQLMRTATTAGTPDLATYDMSICDPTGLAIALDYDVIFSCVDRPWPRAVLNAVAYADLIPVIDGGISIETFSDGEMRGANWRSQTLVPGQPCMACSGQLRMGEVALDQQGLLEDPDYIRRSGRATGPRNQNVAALSASVSAAQLAQFVSLVAAPGGRGVSGPLRYILAPHHLEHLDCATQEFCPPERATGAGDGRLALTRCEGPWSDVLATRRRKAHSFNAQLLRVLDWLTVAITR
jgi:threonine dehydrogenase-like Zn-dependent dehydrogenase